MSQKKRKRKSRSLKTHPVGPTQTQQLDRFIRSHLGWFLLGIIVIGGLCSYLVFTPLLSTNGDNAVYIVLGMSWAQGSGHTIICNPAMPPNTMVPPGYPLLLAPFLALFPDNYLILKLVSTALFILSLPLLLLVIRNRSRHLLMALGVTLFSAVNINLLSSGSLVMTEIPFLFFSLLGIFLLQHSMSGATAGMSRRGLTLFGLSILFLVFAYNIRSIGIVLPGALVIHLILQRRYRLALAAGLASLCLVLPWAIRNQIGSAGGGYLDQFVLRNAYNPALGRVNAADMLARVGSNLKTYGILTIPQALFPSLSPLAGHRAVTGVLPLLGALATLVTLLGFVLKARRSITFLELYIFFFLSVCALWPQMWSGMRFLIPLVPFLIYYFLEGMRAVAAAVGSRMAPLAGKLILWLILFVMVVSSVTALARASGRAATYPPEWENYFLVAEWCRENTPEESVFVARKPSLFYLKARRQVLNYPYTADTEEMMVFLAQNGVDYVILDGFSWTGTTARYLVPAIQAHQDNFRVVHKLEMPNTWVLKTVGLPSGQGGDE